MLNRPVTSDDELGSPRLLTRRRFLVSCADILVGALKEALSTSHDTLRLRTTLPPSVATIAASEGSVRELEYDGCGTGSQDDGPMTGVVGEGDVENAGDKGWTDD